MCPVEGGMYCISFSERLLEGNRRSMGDKLSGSRKDGNFVRKEISFVKELRADQSGGSR